MRAAAYAGISAPVCLVIACGFACSQRGAAPMETPTEVQSDDQQRALADYVVTVDPAAGTMVFTSVEEIAQRNKPALGTKNFQMVNKGNIKFATTSSVLGASTTTPTALTTPVTDSGNCSAGQFCAQISAQNLSGQAAENVWVEITSVSGATVVTKGDRDKGYTTGVYGRSGTVDGGTQTASNYIDFTNGAYYYGNLANNATASRNWRFTTVGTATFTFTVRVLATFPRTSYVAQDGGISTSGSTPFTKYNACDSVNVASPTTLLAGSVDDQTYTFTLPFPLTIYNTTGTNAWVSTNGIFGLGTATNAPHNESLPSTNAPRPAIFPFWDDLYSATDGAICWGLATGVTDRAVVVTWKNFGFYDENTGGYDGTKRTFSLVLQEFSDVAEVQFYDATAVGTVQGGSASSSLQGNGPQQHIDLFFFTIGRGDYGATLGVQNSGGTGATTGGYNTPFLPAPGNAAYPLRILLKANGDPAACPSGGCNAG